jgi:hypothetical protein
MDLTRVIVRGRCLGSFAASNPWEGGGIDRWTVHVYQAVARSFAAQAAVKLAKEAAPPQQASPAQWPDRLERHEAIGIESSDARHHLLPSAVEPLCRSGALPLEGVPLLLHHVEHQLVHADFPLHLPRLVLRFVAPVLAVLAFASLVLGWQGTWGMREAYLGMAVVLLLPLAAWPALAWRWRRRDARLRAELAILARESFR